MALIALGALAGLIGGGVASYFTFGNKNDSGSEHKISAEGAINNVIVKDIQEKIELEIPVAIILYVLCAIKILAVIYFIFRRCSKHMKKKYDRKNQNQTTERV